MKRKNKKFKKVNWHALKAKEVLNFLKVDGKKGLTEKEAGKRLEKHGLNQLPKKEKFSRLKTFLKQFNSPLIYILIVAGIVMAAVKEWADVIIIFSAVLINSLFGYWQERKTLGILEKLKKSLNSKAVVIRDGKKREILQKNVTVGDIVALGPGDKIPADGRVISSNNLSISQAALTGEWIAENKKSLKIKENTGLADRNNMAYSGCLVENGIGKMVITGIGSDTEIGKIASMVGKTEKEVSPLKRKISKFAKKIGIAIGIVSVLIIAGGIFRGDSFVKIFETAVAVAVGGVPEALPVVVTVILAIGMDRLLKKKGLVRKLSSVETLSSTSIICFDKTKTLTEGKMKRGALIADDEGLALKICALANEAFVENPEADKKNWKVRGNATDRALFFAGRKEGILKPGLEKKGFKEISKLPFDANIKYQASLRANHTKNEMLITGAPETLLKKSVNPDGWLKEIKKMANEGYRVVGLGYKALSKKKKKIAYSDVKEIKFIGLIGFKDPLRRGIKNTIRNIRKAGLRPIIITGDYRKTAVAIAKRAGIKIREEEIIEGNELDQISKDELARNIDKYKLYARTEPRQKIKIVKAWQKKGRAVAMVGDGVNDSPAIKGADIGIALGSGTEAAKQAADLVLLNDSFNIIIKAIRESRIILDNIKKSIAYVLADSFTSVVLVGTSKIIFGWPLPILPVQILWNNIIEDTLPVISYAFEPGEKGVLKRKPIPLKKDLLDKKMKILIFGTGFIDQLLILFLFYYLYFMLNLNLDYARTMVFGAICLDTAFVVYAYKNFKKNIWRINLFSNKLLVLSSFVVFAGFAAAVYVPFLQRILGTVSLRFFDWLVLIAVGFASLALIELTKWFFIVRRKKNHE